jgi:hypothetical protein
MLKINVWVLLLEIQILVRLFRSTSPWAEPPRTTMLFLDGGDSETTFLLPRNSDLSACQTIFAQGCF